MLGCLATKRKHEMLMIRMVLAVGAVLGLKGRKDERTRMFAFHSHNAPKSGNPSLAPTAAINLRGANYGPGFLKIYRG